MATPVEEIKSKLDIADFIGRDIRLRKSGRYLKGLCPFHTEKTPSFFVFTDRGTFKCFGCGEGGDVFSYVMRRDRSEFPDALRELARDTGVELRGRGADPEASKQRKRKLAVLKEAGRFMHELLLNSAEASKPREYLADRGLGADTIQTFGLGYAPARGSPVVSRLREMGYEFELIRDVGLARDGERGPRDYFFNRIVFPIWDRRGAIVGFGARALGDAEPKYLNTPDSDVFRKGDHLYAFHMAREAIRQEGSAVTVEGYMDAIAAHEHGFANTVASMGTALTAEQARTLTTSGARRIVLALDADAAGAAATRRGADILRESADYQTESSLDFRGLIRHEGRLATDIVIVELGEGEDPDAVIRAEPDRWRSMLAAPTPLADYYFRWAMREHDLTTLAGKSQAVQELAPIVAELQNPVVRSHYLGRLSELSGVAPDEVLQVARSRRSRQSRRAPAREAPSQAGDRVEEGLLEYVLQASETHWDLVARIDPTWVSDHSLRHILALAVESVRTAGTLDWTRIGEDLDEAPLARLAKLRSRLLDREALDNQSLASALQRVAVRLRRRQLDNEWNEMTELESNQESVAATDVFRERRERLRQERMSVFQAETELSVLIGSNSR